MRGALIAPLAAVSFLTRVPVGRLAEVGARDVARAAPLFPLVGGVVGGGCGLVADALADSVSPLVAGTIAVGLAAAVTGAMHLDALADAADALGGATPERRLEIMRDHAIGAFGAVALVVVCITDAAALGALAAGGDAAVAGLAAGAAGRAAMLPVGWALPYARSGDGQGRVLEGLSLAGVVAAIVLASLLAFPAGAAGWWGLGGGALAAFAVALLFRRLIGGVTGDVLGTVAKVAETATLVVILAAIQ